MTTPLTEQDLILLNAYVDGELTAAERAGLEARLAEDERLQAELESLRVTAALLGMAWRVRVPRNFTLDPAVYGRPVRSGWWTNLGLSGFPAWATAGVTALVVLVCVGVMVMQIGLGGAGAPSVAQFAAQEPAAAATQAPAANKSVEEAPTASASKVGAANAQDGRETHAPEPTMPPPPAPTMVALPTGGGVGGGPSEDMMTAEAGGERTATENGADTLTAPSALPLEPGVATKEPSVAGEGQANISASPPPLPDETQFQAYTAAIPTPTPTPTWAEGHFLGLPVKSILVLAGTIILIAGVALVSIALKRRSP